MAVMRTNGEGARTNAKWHNDGSAGVQLWASGNNMKTNSPSSVDLAACLQVPLR
jgi:hypothetical protein